VKSGSEISSAEVAFSCILEEGEKTIWRENLNTLLPTFSPVQELAIFGKIQFLKISYICQCPVMGRSSCANCEGTKKYRRRESLDGDYDHEMLLRLFA